MRKLIILITAVAATFSANGADTHIYPKGRPLSEALAEFARRNPNVDINFIYNDLENYKTKKSVRPGAPEQTIREIVALNPVMVRKAGSSIYVEALQNGRNSYRGRVISADRQPVEYATVLMLNHRDSTVVTYGITDEQGRFLIPCDRRGLLAKITSVGYTTLYRPASSFSMGEIRMQRKPVELKGVAVTADQRYVEHDRTVYKPSAREKNAARGGMELLQFMAIPNLTISPLDKSVSTISGGDVKMFIDYVPASQRDLDNLMPSDVKRVEVFDYPADPRFEGALHAVNFIMVKYDYGGYTKLTDDQRLDFKNASYSASSKFAYRKMTYDVIGGYDYNHTENSGQNTTTEYEFPDRTVVRDNRLQDSEMKTHAAYASMRAQYTNDKTLISNQISLLSSRTPHAMSEYLNSYNPEIYPAGKSCSESDKTSVSPSWSGNWHFGLPRSIMLTVTPSAKYARNKSQSVFAEDNICIVNDVKEKAWATSLSLNLAKNWKRNSVSVSVSGEYSGNHLHYNGTNPAYIRYSFKAVGAFLSGNFLIKNFWFKPSAKFFFSSTNFGDRKFNQPLPGYYIAGGFNVGPKHHFTFDSEMSQWIIGASQRSPNIVVRNLLDAVQGNPSLKTWLYNSVSADYQYYPLQWLNFSASVNYSRHTKPISPLYEPTEIDGRDMMLQTYIKDGYFQTLSESFSAVSRLFDNSLTLQATLNVSWFKRGGKQNFSRTVVNSQLMAIYYLKNFYFQTTYRFKNKTSLKSYYRNDAPSYFLLAAGWSQKGWNISLTLRNPLRKSTDQGIAITDMGNYRQTLHSVGENYRQQYFLTVSYSVSYGKKVNQKGISRGGTVTSGIVE